MDSRNFSSDSSPRDLSRLASSSRDLSRLATLAAFLSSVPDSQFNLGSWVEQDIFTSNTSKLDSERELAQLNLLEPECGTTACAIGFACLIPEFKKLGFKLKLIGSSSKRHTFQPSFEDKTQFEAVAAFMGITLRETRYLFDPCEYNYVVGADAKNEVIRRITNFVEDGGV